MRYYIVNDVINVSSFKLSSNTLKLTRWLFYAIYRWVNVLSGMGIPVIKIEVIMELTFSDF